MLQNRGGSRTFQFPHMQNSTLRLHLTNQISIAISNMFCPLKITATEIHKHLLLKGNRY